MKLYVDDSKKKIVLNKVAHSREELCQVVGKDKIRVNGKVFKIEQVKAMRDSNDLVSGAIVGGLVGSFSGPFGVVVGGIAGGYLGSVAGKRKQNNVKLFNESSVKWHLKK